jgi:hypothetical protein
LGVPKQAPSIATVTADGIHTMPLGTSGCGFFKMDEKALQQRESGFDGPRYICMRSANYGLRDLADV